MVFLVYCFKCCNDIWICIGMRIHKFNIEKMVHGMVTLQEQYGTMTDNIQRITWYVGSGYEKLWALSFNILFMWDRGSLGESP